MSAAPGWYPQPDGSERWWDGSQWSDHIRPQGAGAPQAQYGGQQTGQYQASQPSSGNGMLKGCLIGGAVLLILAVVVFALLAWLGARAFNDPSTIENAGGETVTTQPGEPFTVNNISIDPGWAVVPQDSIWQVSDMTGTRETDSVLPPVVTLAFLDDAGEIATTICTGEFGGDAGATTAFTCLPMTEDPSGAVEVQASSVL